ncbi:ATPase, T2SS/T4P/T4SS family [Ruegeria sp.]|uniref:ATPase, T2SS/T4P/T4SS family n=1 Tax=Ruegeria sp. TaxID=1879320 RepID=UPI003AFF98DA
MTTYPRNFATRVRSVIDGWFWPQITPDLTPGGAFDIGSEGFRKACALLEDGTVCLVKTYNTAAISAELADLRRRHDLPPETGTRPASLAEIAALYGQDGQETARYEDTGGAARLRRTIVDAVALGASDIKLIDRITHGDLRLKLGAGEFTHGPEWTARDLGDAITWIYNYRDTGSSDPSLVKGAPAAFSIGQSGRLALPEGLVALRGQIGWHGDTQIFLTLRLIYRQGPETFGDIGALGLEQDVLDVLEDERRSENGLVIVGGSTGDGKSTTLMRNLERLYAERDGQVSIYTIEDPIEYPMDQKGIAQFPTSGGKTPESRRAEFTKMLLTFVRINPDIGMVSEIRSKDDVEEVLQFVISGHKIYTSVHAASANAVLFRLISLGVTPGELSGPDVVNLVLRQKLVPTLCRACATPLTGPALAKVRDWLGALDRPGTAWESTGTDTGESTGEGTTLLRRNLKGCAQCDVGRDHLTSAARETARKAWAGYRGRRATAEFIHLDDTYRRFVDAQDPLGARAHWLCPKAQGGMGGIPLEIRLRRLVAQGIADYEWVTNDRLPDSPLELTFDQDGGGSDAAA